jgi:hypothetical protein
MSSVKKRWTLFGALAGSAAILLVLVVSLGVGAGAAAVAVAPQNTVPPTITGTPEVGRILTATHGTWANAPTTFAYQWRRCDANGLACTSIALSGGQKTYTLVASDAGHTMRVRVTATNADGSASARSDQTTVVAPATSAAGPKNTSPPTISGTAKVGQELTANEGTWSGSPTGYSYQWQRCDADVAACTNVIGATGKTYGVRLADLGYRLRVAVTGRNANGSDSANSEITAIVAPVARITNSRPTIAIVSIRSLGATVYARFRICDDSYKNLTILATDSRPGVAPSTRRFTTLAAPRPCGVYTRHWLPAVRFRGHKHTVTLRARDKSGFTSLPARRTVSR